MSRRLPRVTAETMWKGFLFGFICVMCVLAVIGLANAGRALVPGKMGTLGITTQFSHTPNAVITHVSSNSPLAAAGGKAGDHIVFDRDSDRMRYLGVDETVGVTLFAGTSPGRHLELHAIPDTTATAMDRIAEVEALFGSALMFTLGALIGWRRADSPAHRALACSLMSQMLAFYLQLLPGDYVPEGRGYINVLTFVTAYAGFLYFAIAYARDSAFLRRAWIRWSLRLYLVVALALILLPALLTFGIDLRPVQGPFAILSSLSALAALFFSWKSSTGVMRQRLSWILACMGAIYAMYIVSVFTVFVFTSLALVQGLNLVIGLVITAANCGFAYAVLRRRVIDVEFVLNRTTVYGTASVLLAATFVLISQLVNRLIHFEGRDQSRWIDLVIGVAVAMMGRQTARWVDPKVQRLLFRRWHESAAKLKRFGADVIATIPTEELESAYLDAVHEFSGAATGALYLGDGRGEYRRVAATLRSAVPALRADDPLVDDVRAAGSRGVLLQASHDAPAALALPMTVRGELVGVVLVGEKASGESFRRDEIDLLTQSARQLGLELELRRLKSLEASLLRGPSTVAAEDGAG